MLYGVHAGMPPPAHAWTLTLVLAWTPAAVHMRAEYRRGFPGPCSLVLHSVLLRKALSFRLELGCQSASLSNYPVSVTPVSTSSGVTGTCVPHPVFT